MKITKNPNIKTKEETRREKANEGCYVCPVCGESELLDNDMSFFQDTYRLYQSGYRPHPQNGISSFTIYNLFKSSRDKYKCYTCGAEWESERW